MEENQRYPTVKLTYLRVCKLSLISRLLNVKIATMIERSLATKAAEARNQGTWQRVLTGGLRTHLWIARAIGFTDVGGVGQSMAATQATESLWNMQIERLLRLGFHEALGMSEEDYRASMPSFRSQPEKSKGRFDIPILVDPRVMLKTQLQRQKILISRDIPEGDLVKLALGESQRPDIPREPYQIWLNANLRSYYKMPNELDWDEQALTPIEGLAVLREIPDILGRLLGSSMLLSNSLIQKGERIYCLTLEHPRYYSRTGAFGTIGEITDTEKVVIEMEEYHYYSLVTLTRGKFDHTNSN